MIIDSEASIANGDSGSMQSTQDLALDSATEALDPDKPRRAAAMASLAQDFLSNLHDGGGGTAIDHRAYLVSSTLPTVVLGLEQLLREVEQRQLLLDSDDNADIGSRPATTDDLQYAVTTPLPASRSDLIGSRPTSPVSPPATALMSKYAAPLQPIPRTSNHAHTSSRPQRDHLPVPFDPIVWLAQYLFRNNPKHGGNSGKNAAALDPSLAYAHGLHSVAHKLNRRFVEMQQERIAQLKAERTARDQERERRRLIKLIAHEEKHKSVKELTAAIFQRLMKLSKRNEPISLKYLLLVLQGIGKSSTVAVDARLSSNLVELSNSLFELCSTDEQSSSVDPDSTSTGGTGDRRAAAAAAAAAAGLSVDPPSNLSDADLLMRVTGVLSQWTQTEFHAFLAEITRWMDTESERMDERDLAQLVAMLKSSGPASQHPGPSLPDLLAMALDDDLVGDNAGSHPRDPAALAQLRSEIKGFDFRGASESQMAAVLRKVAGSALMTVSDLAALLADAAKEGGTASGKLRRKKDGAAADPLSSGEAGDKDASAADPVSAASARQAEKAQEADAEQELSLIRKAKLKVVFEGMDPDKLGVVVARDCNAIFAATAKALGEDLIRPRPDLGTLVSTLKFAIPVLALTSHVIRGDYWVDYMYRKLAGLCDSDFAYVLKSTTERTKEKRLAAIEGSAFDGGAAGNSDLAAAETQFARELELIGSTVFTDYQVLCSRLLRAALAVLQARHPTVKDMRLDIAMFDKGYTILAASDQRRVGEMLRGGLVGKIAESVQEVECIALEGSDGSLDELSDAARNRAIHEMAAEGGGNRSSELDESGGIGSSSAQEFRVGHVAMVPVKTSNMEMAGIISAGAIQPTPLSKSLATTREIDMFTPADMVLLRRLSASLWASVSTLERIDKTVTIAESSASFLREQASASTRFYIVEGNSIYFADDHREEEVSFSQEQLERLQQHSCRYMRPLRHHLLEVDRASDTDFIFSAAESRSISIRGQATAVPVLDNDTVIAVMVVTSLTQSGVANAPLQDEDMEEVNKVAEVLGNALANVRKAKTRAIALEAEELDEEGEMIFARFMLDTIRDSISKLDASAIAELKSYKKPPLTIHKVLKCLCYLFGKVPKQVKQWSDTLRFINMDLLKQMVQYDPTGVQKKGKFLRIRRVLKTIPHGDVKKRGSVPAQTVYAWLIVSLDLRDKALMARRRAAQAAGKPGTAMSEEGDDTDGEMDGDDGDD
ncbi:hypothetical protein BC828DRAFT_391520 [Blastocladiella britannica]|nr:hypothetical protein BC828DRAFT_391520 [Blastocladiella britannica]